MSNTKHTPGPWTYKYDGDGMRFNEISCYVDDVYEEYTADAQLISAAPELLREMKRYLPILQALYQDPQQWDFFSQGLGIATLNGYENAIAKAEKQ